MDREYIKTLNDDDTLLVKTTLLLYMYSYYEEEGILDDDLKKLFNNIIRLTKYSNCRITPPYFKMTIKDIKMIFAKAPTDIYTSASFKEETSIKKR